MSDLPKFEPKHEFYSEFELPLPIETRRHKTWRLWCWLKKHLVCSWRGHQKVTGLFEIWCHRCRYKLKPDSEWNAVWLDSSDASQGNQS